MSATETARRPGRPVDHGKRKRGLRRLRYRGISVYIPADVLADAGFDPDGPPPWYRLVGHRRSANAGSVIVSLYREP